MKEKRNLHYDISTRWWLLNDIQICIKINSKHKTEVTITITVTQYVQQQMRTNIFSWIIEKNL